MCSYTSQRTNLGTLCREALSLYRTQSNDVSEQVSGVLTHLRSLEKRIREKHGLLLQDCDLLDIGVGQLLVQLQYFGRNNRVVGIDFDVIAQGFNPLQYIEMFWLNGWRRTAKTAARKLLGIDRRYATELKRQLNVASLPRQKVLRMDACKMDFAEASFDFVHCQSVFHHLPTPALAIEEIKRVLKPAERASFLFTSTRARRVHWIRECSRTGETRWLCGGICVRNMHTNSLPTPI